MASGKVDDQHLNQLQPKELSREDLELIFRIATRSLVHRIGDQFADGMKNGELWKALQDSLGIFGGSGGPNQPSVTYQGALLKIWGGWDVVNHVTTKPLFSGQATVDMAREVYGIADPDNDQLNLLRETVLSIKAPHCKTLRGFLTKCCRSGRNA